MRIFLAFSVIAISIPFGRCKIDLKRDKEVIVDIDSPELHQSQYHTADFDTSAYNYGYAVEPNGQFHHETRGGDGVTYGCYGYIDSDDLLKVTHYVADSQGYRTLEHEKPVLVYPINENDVDDGYEKPHKPKGVMLDWKDLYFPIGCGMAKGGVLLNAPVIRAPGGNFQQFGETKFPVQPSNEPKVVVPRIPYNNGIKTEPTKLIPVSTVISPYNKAQDPKTTSSVKFSSSENVNPSTVTTQRPTIRPSLSTKSSNIDTHINGPAFESKTSYRPSQQPTTPPTVSSSHPTRFRASLSPFRESTKVNEPSTVKPAIDTVSLQKVTTPDTSGQGQNEYTEELLPPFRTTNLFDTQTTIGVPLNSFDPDSDFNVINSYANLNPESRTTTQSGYIDGITTTVPIQSQPFSHNYNNNGPSTFASFKQPGFTSTEKISTIRPNKFDGFNFNIQTTTTSPIDFATEPNSDLTNTDSTTVLSLDSESLSPPAGVFPDGLNDPYTNQTPNDISYQTSVQFSSNEHPTGFGFGSSIASQRPVDSYTTPGFEFETSTSQVTYPGIGDYNKPQSGFEFNVPTRAPNPASTTGNRNYFVTNNDIHTLKDGVDPNDLGGVNLVENKEPTYDKTTKFTNGPHGPEYQLGSRVSQPHLTVGNGQHNNFNFLNPIKQSRKDTDVPISLITPLTHLTISGSFPLKNNDTAASVAVPSTEKKSSPPIYSSDPFPVFGSVPEVNRQNSIHPERESNRPSTQQPSGFFTVTTPKNELTRGIITHMNAVSQTRFQSSRVTSSPTSVLPNDEQKPNDIISDQPGKYYAPNLQQNIRPDVTQTYRPEPVKSTEFPFLYTRSRTTPSNNENDPNGGESSPSSPGLITPKDELTIYSEFGQKIKPGTNPATTSFTAYSPHQGITSTSKPAVTSKNDALSPSTDQRDRSPSTDQRDSYKPLPYDNLPNQPKFVLRPTGRPSAINPNKQPLSNFNGYSDAQIRTANFYPDSNPQRSVELSDNNRNNIQPESKYVNTKKEFIPQYNPSSTPVPGSLGTAIGVYPPNVDELVPEIPNFNIAISKWPFYILPFPFTNANIMSFPLFNGMPFQLGGNVLPMANINPGTGVNSGSDYVQGASSFASGGNGAPAQSICSWLSSFIKPNNATNTETPTNENAETLQISNLQVNVKNPQLQINNQNQVPFGIIGFIPIIAVPNCQHNIQGENVDPNTALPSGIQFPSLCSQLSQLLGTQINAKDTNQPLPT